MGMSLEIRETPFCKSFGHGGNNGDPLLENLRKFLVEGKDNP
jgi:hypothetical protein